MSMLGDEGNLPAQGEYTPRGWDREKVRRFRAEIAKPGASYDSVGRLFGFSNANALNIARRLNVSTAGTTWKIRGWYLRAAALLYERGYRMSDIYEVSLLEGKTKPRSLAVSLSLMTTGERLETIGHDKRAAVVMSPARKARLTELFRTKVGPKLVRAVEADLERGIK